LTQKANVNYGKAKMDKMVRRRELPCDRCLGSLYSERAVLMSMEEKKVMKKQRRGNEKNLMASVNFL
jgi:hypothetical protein